MIVHPNHYNSNNTDQTKDFLYKFIDQHFFGFLNKFNPYSEVTSLNFRQAEHPVISFDIEKLWKLKWQYILRGIFLIVKILKKTWIYTLLEPLVNKLKKTNVYQKITK